MIKLLLLSLVIIFFTGCKDPAETKNITTKLTIEKEDVLILNNIDLIEELKSKVIQYDSSDYNSSATYIVFRFWTDSYVGIISDFNLECGAQQPMKWYADSQAVTIKNGFESGALVVFTKKDLDDYNCLQTGGQLEDLTASLYGYAEYSQNRVTQVHHTVTSNDIIYSAQEINEAFAVFNE